MLDPILEEIWVVREKLIKEHGGIDGYFKYVQQLDRTRRRKSEKGRERKVSKPTSKKVRAL